jgi:hypothetical protein
MADPDPLAAELAGIRDRASQITDDHDVAVCIADLGGPCSGHDAERLAAAVERVSALADQWHGERGNDYSASALFASKVREALRGELLGKEETDGE